MFAGLTVDMILFFTAVVGSACFFVGYFMNIVFGAQGFGVLGNMLVLFSGFVIGLKLMDYLPSGQVPTNMVVPAAICVAFGALFLLSVLKRKMLPT
ncbi:hypothetical protein OEG84_13480 [Hoeflea sp. G2-23]|uniref:GlsB/YeaQ/YmgE family stress response membrane protein n=1 Tax=Hoeflea algicola TaxID=2983763 RepID=A0ABT3ZAA6_9HYPH|nr:hypothetical protein [Hoeflea algicola]MCY0148682.1 hypothetical protein [Hoeflea algicola]